VTRRIEDRYGFRDAGLLSVRFDLGPRRLCRIDVVCLRRGIGLIFDLFSITSYYHFLPPPFYISLVELFSIEYGKHTTGFIIEKTTTSNT